MGDPFPHTLCVLDMRLRTPPAGSTFIQEMGRMCGYPATTKTSIASLRRILFPANGVLVKNNDSTKVLGVVYSLDELDDVMMTEGQCDRDRVILEELVYPLPYALCPMLSLIASYTAPLLKLYPQHQPQSQGIVSSKKKKDQPRCSSSPRSTSPMDTNTSPRSNRTVAQSSAQAASDDTMTARIQPM